MDMLLILFQPKDKVLTNKHSKLILDNTTSSYNFIAWVFAVKTFHKKQKTMVSIDAILKLKVEAINYNY